MTPVRRSHGHIVCASQACRSRKQGLPHRSSVPEFASQVFKLAALDATLEVLAAMQLFHRDGGSSVG